MKYVQFVNEVRAFVRATSKAEARVLLDGRSVMDIPSREYGEIVHRMLSVVAEKGMIEFLRRPVLKLKTEVAYPQIDPTRKPALPVIVKTPYPPGKPANAALLRSTPESNGMLGSAYKEYV